MPLRRGSAGQVVLAIAAIVAAGLVAPTPAAAAAGKVVRYDGVAVTVPASWPVYDLANDPHRCVRFDVHAVYLGSGGPDEDCPAHLVGRTEAVQLAPAATAAGPLRVDGMAGTVTQVLAGGRVRVAATYGANQALARQVATSATQVGTPTLAPPHENAAATGAEPSAIGPAATATTAAPTTSTAASSSSGWGAFIGNGFDTCDAPSLATMRAWWSASPYRAANIYIGGIERSCDNINLSASWVSTVLAAGWHLVPTYVGRQAPCAGFKQLISKTLTTARGQGRSAADDAASLAGKLGLPAGSPIYYDMEYYAPSSSCSPPVLAFLQGWTNELHRAGYRSGVYGGPTSVVRDLLSKQGSSYPEPDDVWFAEWNGYDSVFGATGVPDTSWANHQRLHQFNGDTNETYGGYTIDVDADAVDGETVGTPQPCVNYPSEEYGPDGCGGGFALTGPLQYWRIGSPNGYEHHMRWTKSDGATETNGATWAPKLSPGVYGLSVWVPGQDATANAHYTVTDANGAHARSIDQASKAGSWVSLGRYTTGETGSITVHVGDNGDAAGATMIGVDALRFHFVQPIDTQPPAGQLVTPTDGTSVHPGQVLTVSGTFTDDVNVAKVVFSATDANGRTETIGEDDHVGTGTYQVAWPVDFPDGSVLSFSATAYDVGNNVAAADPGVSGVAVDGVAPTGGMTGPRWPFTSASSARVSWSMTDSGSGIASYDLRYRAYSSRGWVSGWHRPSALQGLTVTSVESPSLGAGWEYCFEVRGHDRAGNVSAWSARRCVSRAMDDRDLSALTSGWSRRTASGYYDGTYTSSRHYNVKLDRDGVAATRVSLLATTCSVCGKVRAYLDGHYIGTFNLYSAHWHTRRFVTSPRFAARSGRLTIRTVTSGKRVRIDGVAISHQ